VDMAARYFLTKEPDILGPRAVLSWRHSAQREREGVPCSPSVAAHRSTIHREALQQVVLSSDVGVGAYRCPRSRSLPLLALSLALGLSLSPSLVLSLPRQCFSLEPARVGRAWLQSQRFGQARPFWPLFQQRCGLCCQLSKHRPSRAAAVALLSPVMLHSSVALGHTGGKRVQARGWQGTRRILTRVLTLQTSSELRFHPDRQRRRGVQAPEC